MANKFQKSVLERKKIEAEQRLKEQVNTSQTENIQDKEIIKEIDSVQVIKKAIASEIPKKEPEAQKKLQEKQEAKPIKEITKQIESTEKEVDLSAFLIPQNLRKAKNKSFYLDDDVINAIKTQSTKRKITESKLVNDILKSVLGV